MSSNIFGIVPEEGTEAHLEEATPSEKIAPQTTPAEQKTTDTQPADPTPASPAPDPAPAPEPASEEPPPAAQGEVEDEEQDLLSADGNGFRIGNKVYKDIVSADHAFRQNRGRAKAEAKRAIEAAKLRDEALQENAALKERLRLLEEQRAPQADLQAQGSETPPPAAQGSKRLTERLSREQINELIAEEGADAAISKLLEVVEEFSLETVDARTAPLRHQEQIAEAQNIASETFFNVSQMKDATGNLLFPALQETAPTAPEIVATWDRMVTEDPDFRAIALTPAGVRLAYREWEVSRQQASTRQPASDPVPSRPRGSEQAAQALQGMSRGQRSTPTEPSSTPRQPPAFTEEAVRKLIQAKTHPVFGVTMER